MSQSIFITGTDTGIGKTYITVLLMRQLQQVGLCVAGLKPIASGCHRNKAGQLRNDDALQIQAASSKLMTYEQVNPICFEMPVAPHIASSQVSRPISKVELQSIVREASLIPADIMLIEGAGGWLVPINQHETMSDVISELKMPVLFVVGIRLGCINHALLSVESMRANNVPLIGWIANCLDPEMLFIKENIDTLKNRIAAPCLGIVGYESDFIQDVKNYV